MKKICTIFLIIHAQIIVAQNVGINAAGTVPNSSAALDIDFTNKGLLVPRVALTGTGDAITISSSATSLLVYNTATTGVSPNNVVPGYYYWNGTKWISLSGGSGGNDWSLLGNAGTADGTNFIGTTDNISFNIRVNNQKAGRIDPTLLNTFFGYQAGNANSTTANNIFMGYQAGFNHTTGDGYTFIGYRAGYNNTGNATSWNANHAIGFNAGYSLTTGVANHFDGWQTGTTNTTGSYNTFVGSGAGAANISGGQNTFVGYTAGEATNADFNVFMGSYAGRANIGGANNVFLGTTAGRWNVSGNNNTFMGFEAGLNTTASGNAFVGYDAGITNTTGTNNTYLGFNARGSATLTNATAIGYNANVTANNSLALGGTGADAVNVGIGVTNPTATLDILKDGDIAGNIAIQLRAGNGNLNFNANQIAFGYNTTDQYRHAIKTRHNGGAQNGNAIDFYIWDQGTDAITSIGTKHIMTLNGNGRVGIGTTDPKTILHVSSGDIYLDTPGTGVIFNTGIGGCYRLSVDMFGAVQIVSIICP